MLFAAIAASLGALQLTPNLAGSAPRTSPTAPPSAASDRATIGNLVVPHLAVGTIAWEPRDDAAREARIEGAARASAEHSLLIDTAERYGAPPASLIPAALAGVGLPVPRDYLGGDCESNIATWGEGAPVATKFTPTPWRRSARDVVAAAAASAARLGVESLDLYQIHMPDIIQPFAFAGGAEVKDELYWDGLAECYQRGLVKNVGVSNYGPTLLARAQEHLAKRGVPLASNQIAYNLLYRRTGAQATVDACRELGVAALAYYPLAQGLLSGKHTASQLRTQTDFRSRDLLRYLEGGEGGTAGRVPRGGVRPLLRVLHDVAARRGKTPAQVALNWVVSKGAIPIAGASSALRVEENLGALGWRLSAGEVSELEAAADALPFEFRGSGFQTVDSKFVGYGFERWKLD